MLSRTAARAGVDAATRRDARSHRRRPTGPGSGRGMLSCGAIAASAGYGVFEGLDTWTLVRPSEPAARSWARKVLGALGAFLRQSEGGAVRYPRQVPVLLGDSSTRGEGCAKHVSFCSVGLRVGSLNSERTDLHGLVRFASRSLTACSELGGMEILRQELVVRNEPRLPKNVRSQLFHPIFAWCARVSPRRWWGRDGRLSLATTRRSWTRDRSSQRPRALPGRSMVLQGHAPFRSTLTLTFAGLCRGRGMRGPHGLERQESPREDHHIGNAA